MYKIKMNLAPAPIQELFPRFENEYNLRNQRIWQTSNVRTVGYGTETVLYRGKKTWEMLPADIKNAKTLNEFKRKIKTWIPKDCTCRLCKEYIHDLGFI